VNPLPLRQASDSEAQTKAIGRGLAGSLGPGDLLALRGELGAGKTCFVRGIAVGLGIDPEMVRSPTFVLHHVYPAERLSLHHIDLYRLGSGADLSILDLDTLLEDGVVAVEWAEHADLRAWDPVTIDILATTPTERVITLAPDAPERMVSAFMSSLAKRPGA
jgi:tRNA threonylcarbamoyladenosine biosynthesis protein TsaE